MKKIHFKLPKIRRKKDKIATEYKKSRSLAFPVFNLNKFLAAVSYIYILDFIPLFFVRKNSFVRYHARQGFSLLIIWTIFLFSFYIPVLPYLFALFIFAEMVYGITNACIGKEKPLFLIGNWVVLTEALDNALTKDGEEKNINWTFTLTMSIIFGFLGVDRFIMGHIFEGIAKLVLGISAILMLVINLANVITKKGNFSVGAIIIISIFVIWWLIDFIKIALKSKFYGVKWV